MSEKSIDSLQPQDYSEKPRIITQLAGERSALRLVDFNDRVDMQRFRQIDQSLPPEFADPFESDKEIFQEVKRNRPGRLKKDRQYIFGVAGSEGVSEDEIGELQGWVSFYRDGEKKVLEEKGYIPKLEKGRMVLEVSYARHQDAEPGQMASALRQACNRISQIDAAKYRKDKSIISPQVVVTAYVTPGNDSSEHVLDAAGFENKGLIELKAEEKGEEDHHYNVFVLDWEKLNTLTHGKSDSELFPQEAGE